MSDFQQSQATVAAKDTQPAETKTRVWDRFVRFFHWSLVIAFALAYWSAKAGKHELHAWLGYFLVGLVLARLVWGVIGSSHARFSNFVHSPTIVLRYLKAIAANRPRRFLGHNPAGGIMVVALLVTLVCITFTGLTVLAVIDFDGPLVDLLKPMSDQQAFAAWSFHVYAVNIILGLVGLHLLGVLVASIQHKENLVHAMITGYKDHDEESGATATADPETGRVQLPVYSSLLERNETIYQEQ